jgi:hypothetical protein
MAYPLMTMGVLSAYRLAHQLQILKPGRKRPKPQTFQYFG